MKRQIFLFGFFAMLAALPGSAFSESFLDRSDRSNFMNALPSLVDREFFEENDLLLPCWDRARNGDDASLIALYIIAKSDVLTREFQKAYMTPYNEEGDGSMASALREREAFVRDNYSKIRRYFNHTPAAMDHCVSISRE